MKNSYSKHVLVKWNSNNVIESKHIFSNVGRCSFFLCFWQSAASHRLYWTDFKVLPFQLNLYPLFTTYLTAAIGAATPVNNRKQIKIIYLLCWLVNEFFLIVSSYLFIYFSFKLMESIEFQCFDERTKNCAFLW